MRVEAGPALGAMRLSAESCPEPQALATVHAALSAGATWIDTADVYGMAAEPGHSERLLARALGAFAGDTASVRIATKGGLVRRGTRLTPDGRARHLREACRRSLTALGRPVIDLYQLHAPDPRTPLATSVRALAALRAEGLVAAVGLCNVSLAQFEEAQGIVEVAAVQVELGPFQDTALRNGLAARCVAESLPLFAYRPFGGPEGCRRIAADALLRRLGEHHGVSPFEIVIAWLRHLSPMIVPLPGATQPAHASAAVRAFKLGLDEADLDALDARFPASRLLRQPQAARRPAAQADGFGRRVEPVAGPMGAPSQTELLRPQTPDGDVVLILGLPGAGKSTLAEDYVASGYARLNRDQAGGRLRDLIPALGELLRTGRRRVVLDNTYGSRAARNAVIETAWAHGVPVRCVWLRTPLEQAQVNVAQRLVRRHGRLLAGPELEQAARQDPGAFGPDVLFRHQRVFEPPRSDEGFAVIEERPFAARAERTGARAALLVRYEGVLHASRAGARAPKDADDVVVPAGRGDALRRHLAADAPLLLGYAWRPDVAAGALAPAALDAVFARTHALLGVAVEAVHCPHGGGPPRCWCRPPLPGLATLLVERHQLDPSRCLLVGLDATDRGLARRMGFAFRSADEFFS